MTKRISAVIRPALFIVTALSIFFFAAAPAGAFTNTMTTVRVGICYRNNGSDCSELTLLAEAGGGFSFGYFDESRKFVKTSDAGKGITSIHITPSDGTVAVTASDSDKVIYSSTKDTLAIMPIQSGKKCETWCKGFLYYGGFEVTTLSGGTMQVLNVLNIEDYVKGVIPAEMSPSWPIEALKAQAMCARTYAAMSINSHGTFDVCDTACCQVYYGRNTTNATTDKAVDETAGKYVLYKGFPCKTFFYSSNGGATEESENVWLEDLPYLTAKFDEYDTSIDTGYNEWSYTYTAAEITDILNNSGYSIGTVTAITPVYTAVGNVYSLKFEDGRTSVTVSKQEAGDILCSSKYGKYTHSQRFTIQGSATSATGLYVNDSSSPLSNAASAYVVGSDGKAVKMTIPGGKLSVITGSGAKTVDAYGSGNKQAGATYTVRGSGWGHNVGMSQYGAKAMALKGLTYEDIIKFYFTGVTIG